MKRLLCLLLVFAMTVSLLACGNTPEPGTDTVSTTAPTEADTTPAVFMAGFGIGDITPEESVPLQGYGNALARMSTGLMSYLYSLCLAVRDADGNTALVISVDSAACYGSSGELQQLISEATGVSVDSIIITSIHQHSTPSPGNEASPASMRYKDLLFSRTVKACQDALEDLSPCEMQTATVQTEGLNFVRNYLMNDGTFSGPNYGSTASGYKAHESEADRSLQLLKFVREGQTTLGGKKAKDIIVANFATHPHSGSSGANYLNAHADSPGVFRETVEQQLGCHVMYINGAGGNINQDSSIAEENIYTDYKERGKALAQYAIDAEGSYTKVNTGKVQTSIVPCTVDNDHTMDHLLEEATAIRDYWYKTNNATDAMKLGTSGQVHSTYHAEAIVSKANEPATREVKIPVISFGDIGVTGGPYEMFDTNGMQVKEGAPMAMTIMCNMANGSIGYVPSQLGFDNGGYSTDITRVAPGSGEKMAQVMIDTLTQHRNAQ